MNHTTQRAIQEYKFTLKGMLKFELISLFGRVFLSPFRTPNFTSGDFKNLPSYLNLGCGLNFVESPTDSNLRGGGVRDKHIIINADFFSHLKPYKTYTTPMPQWQLDLRYPLKCPDCAFNGVFSEHTLEHFYIDDALKLLQEIYRILKPKGTLRLSLPSLAFWVERYLSDKNAPDSTKRALANEHIRKLTQEYLHLSVWDYERLEYELARIGFVEIKQESLRQGRDENLLFDMPEREFESMYIEASKPWV